MPTIVPEVPDDQQHALKGGLQRWPGPEEARVRSDVEDPG